MVHWLLAFKKTNQNTQKVMCMVFLYGQRKTVCKLQANVAFNKATNRQMYIYNKKPDEHLRTDLNVTCKCIASSLTEI